MRFAALLTLCAGAVHAQPQPRNCGVPAQNLYVRDVLQQHYYWNAFLPDPDATRFSSAESYLEAVRYLPLDQSFSYIASKAATDALFSASQFVGFGIATQTAVTSDGTDVIVRISQVFPRSPAAEAGLARGGRILAVGGRTVGDWWRSGEFARMFGPSTAGSEATLVYEREGLSRVEVRLAKRVVTIPTVSAASVFEVNGIKTGYLFFRNFVEPSMSALDQAFAGFKEAGVRELVLDLRYNGGGLVSVAQQLASLIGGSRTSGLVLAEYFHNAHNAFRNRVIRFEPRAQALTLERLIVITTRASASASELVINGLRPFLSVVVVGDTTYGKPVGQYGFDFCSKSFFPVAFALRNADGQGEFFGGIAPTCPAADDLGHELGDPAEGSLSEALGFVARGSCSPPVRSLRLRGPSPATVVPTGGLEQLIGAY